MTRKEAQENITILKKVGRMARKDPELAKQLLVSTGMYTADGDLKPQFRSKPMAKAD
jgi:hypothetical protein